MEVNLDNQVRTILVTWVLKSGRARQKRCNHRRRGSRDLKPERNSNLLLLALKMEEGGYEPRNVGSFRIWEQPWLTISNATRTSNLQSPTALKD